MTNENYLTVQDLIDILQAVEDKTLPIGTRVGDDEYWGELYEHAWAAQKRCLQINGPKNNPIDCFFIGQM